VLCVGGTLYSFFLKPYENVKICDAIEINRATLVSQYYVGKMLTEGYCKSEILDILNIDPKTDFYGYILRQPLNLLKLKKRIENAKNFLKPFNAEKSDLELVLGALLINGELNFNNLDSGIKTSAPDSVICENIMDYFPKHKYDFIIMNNVIDWLANSEIIQHQLKKDCFAEKIVKKAKSIGSEHFFMELTQLEKSKWGLSVKYWKKFAKKNPELGIKIADLKLKSSFLGYASKTARKQRKIFYNQNTIVLEIENTK
jgi:hypothetical protein